MRWVIVVGLGIGCGAPREEAVTAPPRRTGTAVAHTLVAPPASPAEQAALEIFTACARACEEGTEAEVLPEDPTRAACLAACRESSRPAPEPTPAPEASPPASAPTPAAAAPPAP